MTGIAGYELLLVSLVLAALGIWALMPGRPVSVRCLGWGLGLLAALGLGVRFFEPSGPVVENALFYTFGGSALLCGTLMITCRNPVYGALWFALATLATCGLFLVQGAPFLSAATIIVYAGAIIVTFLFVMMLAQQSGATAYDQRARQPLIAILAAFTLVGALLVTLDRSPAALQPAPPVAQIEIANPLSHPGEHESLGTLRGLGRSLFGDYLFAVEVAGTLLLVASIGAIAIAPRRSQGT